MTIIGKIITAVTQFIISTISSLGYWGIILLMAIESASIPLPSEIIMPFAGYLVSQGRFSLIGVAFAGAVGCTIGSALMYWIGIKGGRPVVIKYGKYFLVHHDDIKKADKWFAKYGDYTSFFSRLLPVVRTFISLPAGIARVNFPKFIFYTFVGSFIWSYALAYIGMKFGENWEKIRGYFHGLDAVIVILILAGIGIFIWKHRQSIKELAEELKGKKKQKKKKS